LGGVDQAVRDGTLLAGLRGRLLHDDRIVVLMMLRHENPSGICGLRDPGTAGGETAGAQAPVGDFGLVDNEAVVLRGGQAGRVADRAVDIGDGTAGTAYDVMVVVADAALVP